MIPYFSIVVPVYNAENTIKKCIDSLLEQSFDDYEIIIVNDGSTDNSYFICKEFSDNNKIKLINQENNGVSTARNTGIHHSQGQYIIFVDSDDYVSLDMCESFYDILKKHNCDMVIAKLTRVKNNCIIDTEQKDTFGEGLYSVQDLSQEMNGLYEAGMLNSPCARCYERKKITKEFDRNIALGEDLLFNLAYIRNCHYIYLLNKVMYYYQECNVNSLSCKYHDNGLMVLKNVLYSTQSEMLQIWPELKNFEEVHKKFVLDCCVMAERLVQSNHKGKKNELESFFSDDEIKRIFSKIEKNLGFKWNLYKKLLLSEQYYLFIVLNYLRILLKKIMYCFQR